MSHLGAESHHLFDCLLVVDLRPGSGGQVEPCIRFRHPQREGAGDAVSGMEESVTQFCFPDTSSFPRTRFSAETFSFVLTESDGDRRYGYCRRLLQPGSGKRYPRCFCILSFLPCFSIFSQILDEVEKRSSVKFQAIEYFVEAILTQRLPPPGGSITVSVCSWDKPGCVDDFTFARPNDNDSVFDYITFRPLLKRLDPANVIHLFTSILVERRIIFVSEQLSYLSDCTNAALTLISPFEWQHIFIPVLPPALLSYCCAPMPFVVGILKSSFDELCQLPMEEATLVNLDENTVQVMSSDPSQAESLQDRTLLCAADTQPLLDILEDLRKVAFRRKAFKKAESQKLAAAFLRFLVTQTGHYRNHLQGTEVDRPAFIAAAKPESRSFLTLLAGSQMFERFVEEEVKLASYGAIKSPYEQMAAFYRAEQEAKINLLASGASFAPREERGGLLGKLSTKLGITQDQTRLAPSASSRRPASIAVLPGGGGSTGAAVGLFGSRPASINAGYEQHNPSDGGDVFSGSSSQPFDAGGSLHTVRSSPENAVTRPTSNTHPGVSSSGLAQKPLPSAPGRGGRGTAAGRARGQAVRGGRVPPSPRGGGAAGSSGSLPRGMRPPTAAAHQPSGRGQAAPSRGCGVVRGSVVRGGVVRGASGGTPVSPAARGVARGAPPASPRGGFATSGASSPLNRRLPTPPHKPLPPRPASAIGLSRGSSSSSSGGLGSPRGGGAVRGVRGSPLRSAGLAPPKPATPPPARY
mmetsp:Transcript_37836/g.95089  ORF Transcript_37836/g.95089 Transcript_37836/m.95089 type:complete len:750 (+) Transcript_37836:78-2327(+)|eukprot:CAMPEP_0177629314 /NCGR_PEP_ID=MMETSP0447-20121125/601_1 /TAXON_ID=0 /ORGANISM="Stygamoeba regulata, Strain BSH-02190019" /LENGTH=749 /DNA_ID=CAMNT_0019130625 /DNA_START=78 /DNA_END=2327 /DNA_ORIENTATION=+